MKRILKIAILASTFFFTSYTYADLPASTVFDQQVKALSEQAKINPNILKLALQAYNKAKIQGLDTKGLFTIVDYSKPSTERRMWVLDLNKNKVLFSALVAHGAGSGYNYPTRFSNRSGSAMSSLGLYKTGETYFGHNGYSLRLIGLEKGFNDAAYDRNVVMHPAEYVSQEFANENGRLGRSAGCFALDTRVSRSVISTIKDGTLLFAYYPDSRWLKQSKYLST